MLCTDKIADLRRQLADWRKAGHSIALVPTMGNLHAGHLSLVERARQAAGKVVVTIFVNPAQFVAGEDYADYPRTLDQDQKLLAQADTDLLFSPHIGDIYPGELEQQTRIIVPGLDNIYCGKFRPGHFSGVATVVTKLLNLVQPDAAIFGEKDYQQLLVIRQLVRDLCIPVTIISMPTLRESDGLAMSSRNAYLSATERKTAPLLFHTLCHIKKEIENGSTAHAELEQQARTALDQAGFVTEYVAVADAGTLGRPDTGDLVVLAAAHLGRARLIDNVIIRR